MADTIIIGAEMSVPQKLLDMDRVRSDLFIENLATKRKEELGLKLVKSDYVGVELYLEDGNRVTVPRGYKLPFKVYPTDRKGGIHHLRDERPEPVSADIPPFRLTMRDYQLPAVDAVLAELGRGVDTMLALGCAKGKTIIALYVAWCLQLRTLIIVDRDFLADQWIRRLKMCFWYTRERICRLQGNRKKPFEADFTVAMVKTLANSKLPQEWYDQFGLIVPDECVAKGTFVEMADGSQMPVEQINIGDYVATPLGSRRVTSSQLTGHRRCVIVKAGESLLLVTGNHPLAVKEAHEEEVRILWQTVKEGQQRRYACSLSRELFVSKRFMRDMWKGCFREEARCSSYPLRWHRCTSSELEGDGQRRRDFKEATSGTECCFEGSFLPSETKTTDAGRQSIQEACREAQVKQGNEASHCGGISKCVWPGLRERASNDTLRGASLGATGTDGFPIRLLTGDKERGNGYMGLRELHGGLYPPRRSSSCRNRWQLTQGKGGKQCAQGPLLEEHWVLRDSLAGDLRSLRAAEEGKTCHAVRAEFSEETSTLLPVYDLEIEEAGCFFANGVLVHNCHMLGAPSYQDVIPRLPGMRLGLSATIDRKDGMHPVFKMHMGGEPCYVDLERFQPAMWVFHRVGRCLSDKALSKCKTWLPVADKRVMNRAKLDSALELNEKWNRLICKDVYTAVEEGRSCIVLGTRTAQLQWLADALQQAGVDVGYVDSDVKGLDRVAAFGAKVILATMSLASRALDVEALDTLFLLYPSSDGDFLRQAVGRIDRPLTEKFKPMVVTYSHYYIESQVKREDEMIEAIQELDPQGTIHVVG